MSDNVRMATFSIASEEDEQAILPPPHLSEKAHCSSFSNYLEMYSQSVKDPEAFWTSFANELTFFKKWEKGCFLDYNFDRRKGPVYVRWMPNASLNVCYNCLDRNISRQLGDKVAFYWEGNEPGVSMKLTYRELLKLVCKFANVLKRKGVKKGDRVIIYMPMILELPIAMLACARIGAVHSTVFGGYSAQALAQRIVDAKAEVVITADGSYRGKKPILLKQITDQAISICEKRNVIVKHRIIVRHLADNYTGFPSTQQDCKSKLQVQNCWFDEEMSAADENCESEWMDSEDPLFILYTSGSTGVPKGVVHTQAGYLLYVYTTFRYVFDYQDDDVYFCTADIGWITGHSYVVYGPLANGSTVVMFEGVPYYPEPSRYWDVVDKYGVSKFYTAPTAIRHLMKFGSSYVERCRLDRLEVLGSVGEPINPEVWQWYYKVVGKSRCAIVDTYWQTETGGHVLTPLPGCTNMKPGSASFPFFGVKPVLLNHDGQEIVGPGEGQMAFSAPWPGIARSLYGNHDRYMDTYFAVPGYFSTGDGCTRDEDGYYWITGRIDDMMNVSGHLLSSAEIENAVVSHPAVAEAAVVCAPDPVKGQIPYCFVTLKKDYAFTAELVLDIKQTVRNQIGPVATPEVFQQAESLPKTRSGKILRRVLRDVAGGNTTSFGDLSTLSEEHVIADLVNSRSSVVTGLGLVTPLGVGVELCWRRLLQGCIGAVELVDEKYRGCVSRVAALVPAGIGPGLFDRSQFSDGQWRRMTKATAYAMLAAGEALADAQWTPVSDEHREKTGVCVGVGMSDMEDVHEAGCLIDQQRDNRLSPYFIPRVLTNMTAGQLSVSYGLRGPNHCPSTACASGLHAIIDGMALIQRRQAEMMLVGGAEAPVCKLSLVGFGRMGALSRSFNGRPAEASRPFDRRRDGFVIGEGAGMLLLERLEHALQRRAPHIYAELLGYGLSGDGLHLAAPCPYGSGAASCMRKALHDSAVPRDRISYVNAHATSTPLGDRAEFQAIQDVFRGSIGHLLGAAGAVEAAFTVLSCFHGSVPPNVNLHQTDLEAPEIQLAPSDRAQHWTTPSLNQRKIALKNSFGFGGTNACLCIAQFQE